MQIISPINEGIQNNVVIEVQRYIDIASDLYQKKIPAIDVVFNIKGKAAGMYRCYYEKKSYEKKGYENKNYQKNGSEKNDSKAKRYFSAASIQKWFPQKKRQIRFNPWLFAKYPQDSWNNTIPHEVAHYISDYLYDLKKIKPHGVEWKNIMQDFGAEPIVRGNYSLEGIPLRNMKRYDYRCACRKVALSSVRHRRVQNGQQEYRCRDCQEILVLDIRKL
ncbi:MAG: SprT-like domain-containing protein [Cellvibrionaceae bacterium]